ncbi:MAG TPA: cytochrome c [Gemmataceae bacterium]|nr:cytochrome c [Gemmataceae bacterium]
MVARGKPGGCAPWVLLLLLAPAGCRQDMAKQPIGRPLTGMPESPSGGSARPLEPGVVPRGSLADPYEVRTGRRRDADPDAFSRDVFVDRVPIDVSLELVERGRERFNIFCAECHGRLGNGDGKIPERGFTKPPSYYDDLSRGFKLRGVDIPLTEVPDGYVFEVITHGFGAMADYSAQVPVHDRWAIVTYVRALQKSQKPSPDDLKNARAEGAK